MPNKTVTFSNDVIFKTKTNKKLKYSKNKTEYSWSLLTITRNIKDVKLGPTIFKTIINNYWN